MCRRKKKEEPVQKFTPEDIVDNFTLKKSEPVFDENGKRDYFTEYYNIYKNDYVEQYLEAYKKFKEEGKVSEVEKAIDIVELEKKDTVETDESAEGDENAVAADENKEDK